VHEKPEQAKSDAAQTLSFDEATQIIKQIKELKF
jgi:3-deoxy-D-arabino-heptulosonate 7-phosphate (DAHP) synthase